MTWFVVLIDGVQKTSGAQRQLVLTLEGENQLPAVERRLCVSGIVTLRCPVVEGVLLARPGRGQRQRIAALKDFGVAVILWNDIHDRTRPGAFNPAWPAAGRNQVIPVILVESRITLTVAVEAAFGRLQLRQLGLALTLSLFDGSLLAYVPVNVLYWSLHFGFRLKRK